MNYNNYNNHLGAGSYEPMNPDASTSPAAVGTGGNFNNNPLHVLTDTIMNNSNEMNMHHHFHNVTMNENLAGEEVDESHPFGSYHHQSHPQNHTNTHTINATTYDQSVLNQVANYDGYFTNNQIAAMTVRTDDNGYTNEEYSNNDHYDDTYETTATTTNKTTSFTLTKRTNPVANAKNDYSGGSSTSSSKKERNKRKSLPSQATPSLSSAAVSKSNKRPKSNNSDSANKSSSSSNDNAESISSEEQQIALASNYMQLMKISFDLITAIQEKVDSLGDIDSILTTYDYESMRYLKKGEKGANEATVAAIMSGSVDHAREKKTQSKISPAAAVAKACDGTSRTSRKASQKMQTYANTKAKQKESLRVRELKEEFTIQKVAFKKAHEDLIEMLKLIQSSSHYIQDIVYDSINVSTNLSSLSKTLLTRSIADDRREQKKAAILNRQITPGRGELLKPIKSESIQRLEKIQTLRKRTLDKVTEGNLDGATTGTNSTVKDDLEASKAQRQKTFNIPKDYPLPANGEYYSLREAIKLMDEKMSKGSNVKYFYDSIFQGSETPLLLEGYRVLLVAYRKYQKTKELPPEGWHCFGRRKKVLMSSQDEDVLLNAELIKESNDDSTTTPMNQNIKYSGYHAPTFKKILLAEKNYTIEKIVERAKDLRERKNYITKMLETSWIKNTCPRVEEGQKVRVHVVTDSVKRESNPGTHSLTNKELSWRREDFPKPKNGKVYSLQEAVLLIHESEEKLTPHGFTKVMNGGSNPMFKIGRKSLTQQYELYKQTGEIPPEIYEISKGRKSAEPQSGYEPLTEEEKKKLTPAQLKAFQDAARASTGLMPLESPSLERDSPSDITTSNMKPAHALEKSKERKQQTKKKNSKKSPKKGDTYTALLQKDAYDLMHIQNEARIEQGLPELTEQEFFMLRNKSRQSAGLAPLPAIQGRASSTKKAKKSASSKSKEQGKQSNDKKNNTTEPVNESEQSNDKNNNPSTSEPSKEGTFLQKEAIEQLKLKNKARVEKGLSEMTELEFFTLQNKARQAAGLELLLPAIVGKSIRANNTTKPAPSESSKDSSKSTSTSSTAITKPSASNAASSNVALSEKQRKQNLARAAAGLPPITLTNNSTIKPATTTNSVSNGDSASSKISVLEKQRKQNLARAAAGLPPLTFDRTQEKDNDLLSVYCNTKEISDHKN